MWKPKDFDTPKGIRFGGSFSDENLKGKFTSMDHAYDHFLGIHAASADARPGEPNHTSLISRLRVYTESLSFSPEYIFPYGGCGTCHGALSQIYLQAAQAKEQCHGQVFHHYSGGNHDFRCRSGGNEDRFL